MEHLNIDQFESDLLLDSDDMKLSLEQIDKMLEQREEKKLQELLEIEFC